MRPGRSGALGFQQSRHHRRSRRKTAASFRRPMPGSSRKRLYNSAMNSALAPERNVVPLSSVIRNLEVSPSAVRPVQPGPTSAGMPARTARNNIGSENPNSAPIAARALEKQSRRDDRNAAERTRSEQVGVAANDQTGSSVHRQIKERRDRTNRAVEPGPSEYVERLPLVNRPTPASSSCRSRPATRTP